MEESTNLVNISFKNKMLRLCLCVIEIVRENPVFDLGLVQSAIFVLISVIDKLLAFVLHPFGLLLCILSVRPHVSYSVAEREGKNNKSDCKWRGEEEGTNGAVNANWKDHLISPRRHLLLLLLLFLFVFIIVKNPSNHHSPTRTL